MRNRSGAVWSTTPVLFPAWEVEIQMRVTGPGRRGAQGMAMWYTQGRGQVGPVLGAPDLGDGIGIFFDSSAQDAQVSGGLLPIVPPTPSPSALCPGLRLLVASHTEQPCHLRAGHRQAHPLRAAWGWRQPAAGLLPPGLPEPAIPLQSTDHLLGAEAACVLEQRPHSQRPR
uniref:L-type lectin-like domain-containing protein n=1 Tax=Capra hircus TaxID=9925 RepID=A0A8C2XVY5_CAPHI